VFYPSSMAVADVTGDGKPDVLLGACCGFNSTFIMPGNGDGTFNATSSGPIYLGTGSAYLKLLDVNGDGIPELFEASSGNTTPVAVEVFVSTSTGLTASPPSLFFGTQVVATASAAGAVKLTNALSSAVTIDSIMVSGANSGDFGLTHNCPISPSTLAAGNSCTLQPTFTPQATGPRQSAINVSINNSSGFSVQTIVLTGVGAAISASPTSLTFSSQPVGTPSAPMTVTLTNKSSSSVSLYQIAYIGADAADFSKSNTSTCGASLAAGANCTINVVFTAGATGTRTASLEISDNGGGSPQAVPLSGTGSSPAVLHEPRPLSRERPGDKE